MDISWRNNILIAGTNTNTTLSVGKLVSPCLSIRHAHWTTQRSSASKGRAITDVNNLNIIDLVVCATDNTFTMDLFQGAFMIMINFLEYSDKAIHMHKFGQFHLRLVPCRGLHGAFMCQLNRISPENNQWTVERVKNTSLEKGALGRLVKVKHCALILKIRCKWPSKLQKIKFTLVWLNQLDF